MRLLVTGTDTDVGKTLVTAALAAGYRAQGRSVVAAKPVASGVEPGSHGEDAERIARAAGHPPLTWARFRAPLSPHRAQALEGSEHDPAGLFAWLTALTLGVARAAPPDPEVVLVEAAGGWRVPLLADGGGGVVQAADLARHLRCPVLVVAANRLGVLNHSLLTVEAIRRDGLGVAGIVLVDVQPNIDESTASNLDDLRSLLDVPVVRVPHLASIGPTILAATGSRLILDLGL